MKFQASDMKGKQFLDLIDGDNNPLCYKMLEPQ